MSEFYIFNKTLLLILVATLIENPVVFPNIVDLPPTEEVSDNELETIDNLNEEIIESNFGNVSINPNSIAQIDQCNDKNTFCHNKEPSNSNQYNCVDASISDNSKNKLLETRPNRPSNFNTPKIDAFSPHSPLSSPDLNDLEDIRSNSPAAFASETDSAPLYLNSNTEQVQYPRQPPHRLIDRLENQRTTQYKKPPSPNYIAADRYQNYSNIEETVHSPERFDQYNSHNQQRNRPFGNPGCESDFNEQYKRSPHGENFISHIERDIMARDRHSSNHRSEHYDSREKSRNHRDSENDYYDANSKHGRRERSISSDRNSYQDKNDVVHKRRDKKSKKSKKNKKDKKYRDYHRGKGSRDQDYNDMDGSPFSSDPDIEGRNSRTGYRHGRNRSRTGIHLFMLNGKYGHYTYSRI